MQWDHTQKFQFLLLLDPWDIIFYALVVFGLVNNLLFKSVLGHCAFPCFTRKKEELLNFFPGYTVTRVGCFFREVRNPLVTPFYPLFCSFLVIFSMTICLIFRLTLLLITTEVCEKKTAALLLNYFFVMSNFYLSFITQPMGLRDFSAMHNRSTKIKLRYSEKATKFYIIIHFV